MNTRQPHIVTTVGFESRRTVEKQTKTNI